MEQNELNQLNQSSAPIVDKNTSALVCGLLSSILSVIFGVVLSLPCFFLGLFAIIRVIKYKKRNGKLDTFSAVGLVGGIIGLLLSGVYIAVVVFSLVLTGSIFILPFLEIMGS
ncbi:MAG: hypothetical protein IJZ37_05340 [Clostridia bacterium]|nr:hypothetical protein [Clostridia bacterium]MBQ8236090.1 hypothetical protein [Clostridia bacterium]MBQ8400142.1 hypothetical protein [Clostridia bacterium]